MPMAQPAGGMMGGQSMGDQLMQQQMPSQGMPMPQGMVESAGAVQPVDNMAGGMMGQTIMQ